MLHKDHDATKVEVNSSAKPGHARDATRMVRRMVVSSYLSMSPSAVAAPAKTPASKTEPTEFAALCSSSKSSNNSSTFTSQKPLATPVVIEADMVRDGDVVPTPTRRPEKRKAASVEKSEQKTGRRTRSKKQIGSTHVYLAGTYSILYTTLLEAGRKANPKASPKRKASIGQASSSAKRKKTQDDQTTAHEHSSEPAAAENATVVSGEEGVAQEPQSPPTTSRSSEKSRNTMNLSPTKDGLEWQAVWAAIVKKQPINRVTNKPFVWLDNLTKVLMFMWGSPQGVDCVLKMVEAVYRDFDSLKLDAITSVSNSKSSVYTLEMRYKRVLSLSKAATLQTAELLLEYKNMADDFTRLEQQTQDPSTKLGKEWAKRETNAKKRQQIRQEEMTKKEKEAEIAKLRKMREHARNIDNMIAMFGWGVVPLLACAPWKQVFADVSNTSAYTCLQELAKAVPDLRRICDRLDKNFYRYLRIPGQITQLPKDCLQGMSVKKQDRLSYTIAYHFAAPGEREEPAAC
ncbi:hypothetical protein KCU71_g3597, partial [Aureobasidium melanogenum]